MYGAQKPYTATSSEFMGMVLWCIGFQDSLLWKPLVKFPCRFIIKYHLALNSCIPLLFFFPFFIPLLLLQVLSNSRVSCLSGHTPRRIWAKITELSGLKGRKRKGMKTQSRYGMRSGYGRWWINMIKKCTKLSKS